MAGKTALTPEAARSADAHAARLGLTREQLFARIAKIAPERLEEHLEKLGRFRAVVQAHVQRQQIWLQKFQAAEHAHTLLANVNRWDRELMNDLAPIVGEKVAWEFARDLHTARIEYLSKGERN